MAVTNPLKQSSNFEGGEWTRKTLSDDFINDKLEEMKSSYSTLLYYAQGVYITSLSRKHLLECVYQMDADVIYMDTDSIKYKNNHDDIFINYNNNVDLKYKEVIKKYPSIKMEDFKPCDKNGNAHPLGYFEDDGEYEEFLSIGAKKYVARENGKLKMTLSGVAKSGVKVLNNDINNFKKGLIFDYDMSGKLTHTYIDNQTPVEVDGWKSELKYGIVLNPTTYTLGITELYELLIEEYYIKECEEHGK